MKSKFNPPFLIFLITLLVFSANTANSFGKKDELAFANFTYTEAESCDDDCSYFAQSAFADNMMDYEITLAGCLDEVSDDVITAWAGALLPGIPDWTNFPTVYDLLTSSYPTAMNCLSQAETTYNESMDNSADEWEDCAHDCANL
ncbi:hypothetical protein ABIE26_000291 [Pedobacter africanus]|uniref:Uncharacterized protein n=1 Tax=Pedobacter africanus TaxID=151894 RepID=A0ACC6KVH9_9SPHI|nr:hypothetical protein [Pedobacter africanus]MDR6783221.1 hypothetical protein [Pedobacter africanus]